MTARPWRPASARRAHSACAVSGSAKALARFPRRGALAPRELARFAGAVRQLTVEGGRAKAEGDDRRPVPLADGDACPADHQVVEGAFGRYAWPRRPIVRQLELPLPDE